jgi:hypothetical protein
MNTGSACLCSSSLPAVHAVSPPLHVIFSMMVFSGPIPLMNFSVCSSARVNCREMAVSALPVWAVSDAGICMKSARVCSMNSPTFFTSFAGTVDASLYARSSAYAIPCWIGFTTISFNTLSTEPAHDEEARRGAMEMTHQQRLACIAHARLRS